MKSCKSIGLASNWMDMRANDALVHGSSVCVYIYFYLYFESNTQKTFMVQRLSVKVFYTPPLLISYTRSASESGIKWMAPKKEVVFPSAHLRKEKSCLMIVFCFIYKLSHFRASIEHIVSQLSHYHHPCLLLIILVEFILFALSTE